MDKNGRNARPGCVPRIGSGLGFKILPFQKSKPIPQREPSILRFGEGTEDVQSGNQDDVMSPGVDIADDYHWLSDEKNRRDDIMDHLREENAYTNYQTRRIQKSARIIYKEMVSHIQETDSSVPTRSGTYLYYNRTLKGSSYKLHCRKKVAPGKVYAEEVILNENLLAQGNSYCDVYNVQVSPNHEIVAFAVDLTGDEKYTIMFRHIKARKVLEADRITDTNGNFEWDINNKTVWFVTTNSTERANCVWNYSLRSTIHSDGRLDVSDVGVGGNAVFYLEENDPTFSVSLRKSLSGRFIFISSASATTSVEWYLDFQETITDGRNPFNLIAQRQNGVLYRAEHDGEGQFFIVTNQNCVNFKVMHVKIGNDRSSWRSFINNGGNHFSVSDITSFKNFSVLEGREDGLPAIWIIPEHDASKRYKLEFFEKSSDIGLAFNKEFDTNRLRVWFSSMTTPTQVWEYDVDTKERFLLKERPILNYDRTMYESTRIMAKKKSDATEIPITLVWNKSALRNPNGANLLHLYSYGAYGVPLDATFDVNILPLLDRGVIFAMAHVRGGGEFGREWYDEGSLEKKNNSIEDFITCAQHLINEKWTSNLMMSIEGSSAGGIIIGAAINSHPHIFRACLAGVPFVDVLNTLRDETVPYTTSAWTKWGNPHQENYFKAIQKYCPYQNVSEKHYPAVLTTTGLRDRRVMYAGPAKWVAKLRDCTTSKHDVLLKVDMNAGHFSSTDRYRNIRERAFELTWLMQELGVEIKKLNM